MNCETLDMTSVTPMIYLFIDLTLKTKKSIKSYNRTVRIEIINVKSELEYQKLW